ncbi:DNA-directed RNA polymerase specialized sigma subunit [Streptococcus varani]|uniref:DNA-directed RNA polymerase specialized sigma subunit n=1 Tax=Streptococcus varani TaxID=1608583 RepID=A0A0E4CTM0_9STRE|nr:sigma-70 family RNA polymerase sigma factor [Streptococcus varani]CQR25908.1 DNA-directed RNA polymerase specialized sigma subunit [Streptococcus varani]
MRLDQYEKELVAIAEEIDYYLMKSGASKEDSYDVTQDVLVKILESNLVLPLEKIRAWMYRVAVRTYIDTYRREKRYREILQREFFRQELTRYDQDNGSELYDLVLELATSYRLVIDLYYFQGFSVKEISHILGYSQAKVKVTLMRGRNKLKIMIKERGLSHEELI